MVESQYTHRTSMEDHKVITKVALGSEMSLNTNSAWHYLQSMILGKIQKNLTVLIRLNSKKWLAEAIQMDIRLFNLSSTIVQIEPRLNKRIRIQGNLARMNTSAVYTIHRHLPRAGIVYEKPFYILVCYPIVHLKKEYVLGNKKQA